jgi:hypothetical protein
LTSDAILVATISGAVSVAAAGIALLSNRSVARLSSALEEQRRLASKRERAEELRARYRDPLLATVFDLQSRLYNIVAKRFLVRYLGTGEHGYAIDNTLHLLAEYLAWVEIIRREIQFLNLGDEVANREWLNALEEVRDAFARDDIDPVLRIFRGDQRAIGEAATLPVKDTAGGRRHESLGYASFVARRQTKDFDRWFRKLESDLGLLAAEPDMHLARVTLLQNRLIDVLEIFDPECRRFPAERRARLPLATAEGAVPCERTSSP